MSEFRMTPELGAKVVAELNKMESVDLVRIGKKRRPKNFPERLFKFMQYRAGMILETRADRWDARRKVEGEMLDRQLYRCFKNLIGSFPASERAEFAREMNEIFSKL